MWKQCDFNAQLEANQQISLVTDTDKEFDLFRNHIMTELSIKKEI
jgi:hypothetical protein